MVRKYSRKFSILAASRSIRRKNKHISIPDRNVQKTLSITRNNSGLGFEAFRMRAQPKIYNHFLIQ